MICTRVPSAGSLHVTAITSNKILAEQPFHIRSISLPSTSQPTVLRVEEELQRIRISVASSSNTQSMSKRLDDLTNLYDLIEELLRLPSSQHSLQTCQKKLVEEQLDFSLKLLDLIGVVKDILHAIIEHIQVLRSAIRRKQNLVSDSRKKVQKMIKDCAKSLKQMDCSVGNDRDHQLVNVFKQVQEITKSFLESVVVSQPKSNTGRWSIISKTMSKRKSSCELGCEGSTEKESVQLWLCASYDSVLVKDTADAVNKLEELKLRVESLESGLECLFRQLIQNRVWLLNIISL